MKDNKIRLQKFLSQNGIASRRKAEELIADGKVKINGRKASLGDKIDPFRDKITVSGKRVINDSKKMYIMLNKPKGVVSASRSPGEKTVVDLVPDSMKRDGLFPAGRLDKDTTGFVLITDDGAFAHEILAPKKHVEKTNKQAFKDMLKI